MATCAMREDKALVVTLDAVELETVGMHGKRESLSVTDAMADLVEYVIGHKRCEICTEEKGADSCTDPSSGSIDVHLKWPKRGPYGYLDKEDQQFVADMITASLEDALSIVTILRHFKR